MGRGWAKPDATSPGLERVQLHREAFAGVAFLSGTGAISLTVIGYRYFNIIGSYIGYCVGKGRCRG